MEIKNIRKLKNGKYELTLISGDKVITYDEVIIKNNLLYKKNITSKEIDEIEKLNTFYDIYDKAIKHISKKMRSTKEIKEYLEGHDLSSKEEEELINKLKKIGMVNDEMYVKAYVSDKIHLSSDGPNKIKNELLKNNIKEEIIDEELSKIDDEELINKVKKIINKKVRTSKTSSYNTRQKIYLELTNLGYSKELIDKCYNDDRDDESFLERDFNKIYKDVSRKETDENKIYLKIKQKLYQKGYKLEQIDRIINEKRN